ncbi:unnamed protein product [Closterium sp. NIES-64]|nr:unnamed protein product [Closterium sp. NIES-64]
MATAVLKQSVLLARGTQSLADLQTTSGKKGGKASSFFGASVAVHARSRFLSGAAVCRRVTVRDTANVASRRFNLSRATAAYTTANVATHDVEKAYEVADAEELLKEHGACGVGLIASLKNESTHKIIEQGLTALGCMEHRGGCSADNDSGDGAGLMTAVPWDLLDSWQQENGRGPLDRAATGVGMVFLPKKESDAETAKKLVEAVIKEEGHGLQVVGWRQVPVNEAVVGPFARVTLPAIQQLVLSVPGLAPDDTERELYILRKLIEKAVTRTIAAEAAAAGVPTTEHPLNDLYFCSLSSKTIIYKGMLRAAVVGAFYADLKNELFRSPFAIYHRRFSTNTTPKWLLAQPMRFLGHNGEINTLQGNLNWMVSREPTLTSPVWRGREADIFPVVNLAASDSANLDGVAELLLNSGRRPEEVLMMLVPEAYQNHPTLSAKYPEVVSFYEYYKSQMEAWDGPALLVFSNGRTVGACLDRNGLRPARYWRTNDDMLYVASEVGVLNMDEATIVSKGRLGPGMMISVDLHTGEVLSNTAIKRQVANAHPFKEWLDKESRQIVPMPFAAEPALSPDEVLRRQNAYGYSSEDVVMVIESMAAQAIEPTFCMGDDTPLPVLSARPPPALQLLQAALCPVNNSQSPSDMAPEGDKPGHRPPARGSGDVAGDCMHGSQAGPICTLYSRPLLPLPATTLPSSLQVTNPAIDPLREGLVMSLEIALGRRDNILDVGAEHANVVRALLGVWRGGIWVLNEAEMQELMDDKQLAAARLPIFFDVSQGVEGALSRGLDALCAAADAAVDSGAQLLVLSDNADQLDATRPAIPALLAVGAVHHHLIRTGKRLNASIVVETAQCFSTHHFACLVGYGASAVCAYGALETVRQWRASEKTQKLMTFGKLPTVTSEQAQLNYRKAIEKGLMKILSKMGISLLSSYCGAQIFEIYGLGAPVVDRAFKGSVSRIGGLTLDELANESLTFWAKGFGAEGKGKLENMGFLQVRQGGEYHSNNPEMSKLLHKAVRQGEQTAYSAYQAHLATRPVNVLRDLLELDTASRTAIPLEEVESAASIATRFCTGGMSLGAISRECHEVIAVAMNRLGGKSNSGEGGEDPMRWVELEDVDADGRSPTFPHLKGLRNGDKATSAIKQVASGRFGVTPTFLANAEQLEIKVAQGAKPGEGGQLPGKKVSPYIAQLRSSKPGVPLISPPPHHDIYSIEDLAQLIFDLHQVNPAAKVSVKLVAEAGIGTVASGVAKANADIIQISGHDGGTGASPISSIKHAGGPWEMGLTETHQTLLANGLRDRVVLRVDGGIKCGTDVLVAAAMGADEFGFGSLAMIATGCIMARICHTNNCPVGVASQREELRARFPGVPSDLVNYFVFVAEEVRVGLASLGMKSLDELVGRVNALKARDVALAKTNSIDLSYLLTYPGVSSASSTERMAQEVHSNGPMLDDTLLANPTVMAAIEQNKVVQLATPIVNTDRSTCGRVAGAIAKRHGDSGFTGAVNITFKGSAGQSFGCFLAGGMNIRLIGEANDYVGKGMAGGQIVVVPSKAATFQAETATIIGNTCLYGATGGRLFVRGCAGERFAVRNSNAQAVLEGAGDHCCEYMTGGTVVALGKVGRNVAAGMTGGIGYFLDEDDTFSPKVNREIVAMQRVVSPGGQQQLKSLIQDHAGKGIMQVPRRAAILADWDKFLPLFWQLVPPSEANSPEAKAPAAEEPVAALA